MHSKFPISITVFLLLFVNPQIILGQEEESSGEKWSFSMDTGPAFTESGDLLGAHFGNELRREIHPKFEAGAGFAYHYFSGYALTEQPVKNRANIRTGGLNLYYLPLQTEKIALSLGIGGIFRSYDWLYRTKGISAIVKGEPLGPNENYIFSEHKFGYTGTIGGRLFLPDNFYIRARYTWQSDIEGEELLGTIIHSLRIGIARKF